MRLSIPKREHCSTFYHPAWSHFSDISAHKSQRSWQIRQHEGYRALKTKPIQKTSSFHQYSRKPSPRVGWSTILGPQQTCTFNSGVNSLARASATEGQDYPDPGPSGSLSRMYHCLIFFALQTRHKTCMQGITDKCKAPHGSCSFKLEYVVFKALPWEAGRERQSMKPSYRHHWCLSSSNFYYFQTKMN